MRNVTVGFAFVEPGRTVFNVNGRFVVRLLYVALRVRKPVRMPVFPPSPPFFAAQRDAFNSALSFIFCVMTLLCLPLAAQRSSATHLRVTGLVLNPLPLTETVSDITVAIHKHALYFCSFHRTVRTGVARHRACSSFAGFGCSNARKDVALVRRITVVHC